MCIVTSTEPTHRRGQVVDEKILAAAIEVIENSGTLAIKVDDVAEVAGVNKTTIYRRYPERGELVLAAIRAVANAEVPIPDTGSLRGDLTALAEAVASVVTSPLGRALLSAAADTPEFVELRIGYWEGRFSAASEIIHRAATRGECRGDVDAPLLVEVMVAPIHFRAIQTSGAITAEFVDLQVARLLDAVAI